MSGIVLDTSAILAVYLDEPAGPAISAILLDAPASSMSTVNLAECLMVLDVRVPDKVKSLREQLLASTIEFIAPDLDQAVLAASARAAFPLNFGDCFAYALAKTRGEPLLTLDADFRAVGLPLVPLR